MVKEIWAKRRNKSREEKAIEGIPYDAQVRPATEWLKRDC